MFVSKVAPLAAVFISGVWAQIDVAQCGSGFDWNQNSLGQDPCTVGSKLDAACRGLAQYTWPPVNSTQYYLPPSANHTGDLTCDCNTVMYSLYMACASCQGASTYSWLQYIPECTNLSISQYPAGIAQGTAVPHWAYYNITMLPNQQYNNTVAQNTGRNPETFPKTISTVFGSSTSSGSKSSTGTPQPTGVNGNSKSGGTNVGAIVGGVVGSVVPLTILAVVVYLYTRNRRSTQYQEGFDQDPYKQHPPMGLYSPPNSVTHATLPNNNARGAYPGMAEIQPVQ